MKTNNYKIDFYLIDNNLIQVEVGIGKKENSKYARKYLNGCFEMKIDYVGDRFETLPEMTIENLIFEDENLEQITLRESNYNRLKELIENELNDLHIDDLKLLGVDEERVIYYDETPVIYTL